MAGAAYAPCNGPQWCDAGSGDDCRTDNGNAAWCVVPGSDWNNPAKSANPGMFGGRNNFSCKFADVLDGLSNTLMLSERRTDLSGAHGALCYNFQGCPTGHTINSKWIRQSPVDGWDWWYNMGASSYHPGGAMFCVGDGSVSFLTDSIDFKLYNYLGDRRDKEQASVP